MTIIKCTLMLCAFNALLENGGTVRVGPLHPPSKGEVWPKPQKEKKGNMRFDLDPANFKINITDFHCTLLSSALLRFDTTIQTIYKLTRHQRGDDKNIIYANHQGALEELVIELTNPCEDYPQADMDERYNLTVAASSKLQSTSIWGVMRGLETFTHLLYLADDYKAVLINATQIKDYPRYSYRGVMLDTSRHYLTLTSILKTLEAMAINKMNVFHWHLTDDPSFSYQSERFPELSKHGAYHPSMVYTKADIEKILKYATDRGIRVVPEFDVPAHSRSWGVSHPEILTQCGGGGLGPMNPIKNETYNLLRELFEEVMQAFPDQYFHLGGDELDYSCWKSNKDIRAYMKKYNISNMPELHAMFMDKTIALLGTKKIIVWEEIFTGKKTKLSKDALVEVWTNDWKETLTNVVKSGHRALFSALWYLDTCYNYTFKSMYELDPRYAVRGATKNATLMEYVVGGEAPMWGEMADDRNVQTTMWPRASAVAEVLWSAHSSLSETVYRRIEEHTCRMVRRGIASGPASGAGFCLI